MKGKQNLVKIRGYSNLQPEFILAKEALSKEGIEAVFFEHNSFKLYQSSYVVDILVKKEDVKKSGEILKELEESLRANDKQFEK